MSKENPSLPRRKSLIFLTILPLWGCAVGSQQSSERFGLSEEDKALRHKFRGISGGGELLVSATYDTDMRQLVYQPNGKLFAPLLGIYSPKKSGTSAYFGDEKYGLPIPKYLRYQRFSEAIPKKFEGRYWDEQGYQGPPEVDIIVPVATRIPDEVLDRIRKYKGSLKLKLRMTPETILVGWEIRHGKNYPWKKDEYGRSYATDEDIMIGGDFCEKQILFRMINGKLQQIRRKGWQIDPKTGRKIETDF